MTERLYALESFNEQVRTDHGLENKAPGKQMQMDTERCNSSADIRCTQQTLFHLNFHSKS